MSEYIECGKITNTFGIKGALKIQPWCDSVDVLLNLNKIYLNPPEYNEIKVLSATETKGMAVFTLQGYDDIDTAAKLKNKIVYAKRCDIPLQDGDYFIADLIGLDVIDANTGFKYGVLVNVITDSAQDIYEIKTENAIKLMPVVPQFVKEIDIKKGIYVTPIPGIFD